MTTRQITIEEATSSTLDELYANDAYTITGAGGELNGWVEGYNNLLEKENIGTPTKFYTFKGSLMNAKYDLTGEVAYDKDLTFLAFPLEGLNVGKLAMFKLRMQDRWFNDIVDNNHRHMGR